MGVEKTIKCSMKDCNSMLTVKGDNKGFNGWHGIHGGLVDEDGDPPHICPDCLHTKIKPLLKEG